MCLTAAALLTVFLDFAIIGSLCMSLYYLGLLFYTLKVLPFFGYKAAPSLRTAPLADGPRAGMALCKAVYPNKYSTTFKVIKEQGKHNARIKETSGIA